MSGDERKRYCEECQRFVYDFSKMTHRQIEAIVATSGGRLCARLTRKEDGSLLTLEIPPLTYSINRRPLPVASAVMTVILSVNAAGVPQPLTLPQSPLVQIQQNLKKTDVNMPAQPGAATLLGILLDPAGAVIPGAKVTLINEGTREERSIVSSTQGEYRFAQLPQGVYTLEVVATGFMTTKVVEIKVQAGQEHRVDATLEANSETVTMGVIVAVPPLRQLYQESELAAVVTIGESVAVEFFDDGEIKRVKTWLYISSVLKGEGPGQVIELYRSVRPDAPDEFALGNQLLVFLKRRRSEDRKELLDGYEGNLDGYGIKKLSKEGLEIYLRRIKELDELLKREQTEYAEMLAWLVRCAEDPATRWEGASELAGSIRKLCELGAKDKCQTADGKEDKRITEELVKAALLERQEGEARAEVTEGAANKIDDVRLAALLSKDQKEQLLTALYKTEQVDWNDLELITLAQDWKDARLAPFLFGQLRRIEAAAPPLAMNLIVTLADLLNDKEIVALAEDYMNNLSYEDFLDEDGSPRLEDEKKPLTEAGAAALAARSERLRKFIFAAQSKVNLLAR
jgi:hypothetical protein